MELWKTRPFFDIMSYVETSGGNKNVKVPVKGTVHMLSRKETLL